MSSETSKSGRCYQTRDSVRHELKLLAGELQALDDDIAAARAAAAKSLGLPDLRSEPDPPPPGTTAASRPCLAERLADRARANGVECITATTIVADEPARHLLQQIADPVSERCEDGVVHITARLRGA